MRLFQSKRFRCFALLTALVAVGASGLWIFLICTRDPISAFGFRRLQMNMSRADVERELGGPAAELVRVNRANVEVEFDTMITYSPSRPTPKIGDLTMDILELKGLPEIGRTIAEEHTWTGPEGRLKVLFDEQGRLATAWFVQRVTWRYKLQQWLPWLK